jgi:hypothetical protein
LENLKRRLMPRLEDNIKINLKDVKYDNLYWIHLALSREMADNCEQINEPRGS